MSPHAHQLASVIIRFSNVWEKMDFSILKIKFFN